jgi:hypothetical protein
VLKPVEHALGKRGIADLFVPAAAKSRLSRALGNGSPRSPRSQIASTSIQLSLVRF